MVKKNNPYQIRNNAYTLLRRVYYEMNDNFKTGFHLADWFDPDVEDPDFTQSDLIKAINYLRDGGFITSPVLDEEDFTCIVTAKGIDWVEITENPESPTRI